VSVYIGTWKIIKLTLNSFLVVLFGQLLMPMRSSSKVVRGEGMEHGVVMVSELISGLCIWNVFSSFHPSQVPFFLSTNTSGNTMFLVTGLANSGSWMAGF
jgi:hypothetical protein